MNTPLQIPRVRFASVLALTIGLVHFPCAAQNPAAPKASAAVGAYRDLAWEEMVPKDWDPLKSFKGMDLSKLKDNDPEAATLLKRMRATWDNAPTNRALAGAAVRIPGFVVPLEEGTAGLKEFLLVPYFGACIHTPPPPANQIIYVKLKAPATGLRAMDPVWVNGTLSLARTDNEMGASGYQMDAVAVAPYVEKRP
jgi:uncharacterized protein